MKAKKDLLFGLTGKQALVAGIVIYIVARFLITGFIPEVIALWFIIGGLGRWNREIKARKAQSNN